MSVKMSRSVLTAGATVENCSEYLNFCLNWTVQEELRGAFSPQLLKQNIFVFEFSLVSLYLTGDTVTLDKIMETPHGKGS